MNRPERVAQEVWRRLRPNSAQKDYEEDAFRHTCCYDGGMEKKGRNVFRTKLKDDQEMNSTTATLCTQRPMSSTERARLFAQELARRSSPPSSLASSLDGDAPLLKGHPLTGDLVELKSYLDDFDRRLHEPLVGQIMDTRNATAGHLYDVRDELRR